MANTRYNLTGKSKVLVLIAMFGLGCTLLSVPTAHATAIYVGPPGHEWFARTTEDREYFDAHSDEEDDADFSPGLFEARDLEGNDLKSNNVTSIYPPGADGEDGDDLDRRFLGLSTYEKAEKKGARLLAWMKDPKKAGSQASTPFHNTQDLKFWGYTRSDVETKDYSHVTAANPELAQKLGTDLKDGMQLEWIHSKDTTIENKPTYYATNAKFSNVYWPTHGIIMANDNYGPAHQVAEGQASRKPWKDSKGKPLPLKSWSDVNYLSWKTLITTQRRATLGETQFFPLRVVLRRNIQNPTTRAIIAKALAAKQKQDEAAGRKAAAARRDADADADAEQGSMQLTPSATTSPSTASSPSSSPPPLPPLYPGTTFRPSTAGFAALLATPNVSGVAWLLLQHAGPGSAIGGEVRRVVSITVWRESAKGPYAPTVGVEVGGG